jgi:rubrerythrin
MEADLFCDPEDCDHYWATSALLSEWWALLNLDHMAKEYKIYDELYDQIADEARHMTLLRGAMEAEGYEPPFTQQYVYTPQGTRLEHMVPMYAMQEVIYHSVCGIDLTQLTCHGVDMFKEVHEVTERRAVWIYKTYIKGGQIERYKDVCREIIEDERGHIHKRPNTKNPVMKNLHELDRWVFLKHLPRHYNGMQLLECAEFWDDYYTDNLTTAHL